MAQDLVATVWFRRVERITRVSDVLRAMEHPESEPGQEVARRQVASDRANDEASSRLEELRDVLELGDVVLPVAAVLLQLLEVLIELLAGVPFV